MPSCEPTIIRIAERGIGTIHFLLLLAIGAGYVLLSSRSLPDLVASHFDSTGVPNGYMTRGAYIAFLILILATLPLGLVYLPSRLLRIPEAQINVPNGDYWLAPERRSDSIDFLCDHLARFGLLLMVFACYVHWLVLRANALKPPGLSSAAFMTGLIVFFAAVAIWAFILMGRFKRISR